MKFTLLNEIDHSIRLTNIQKAILLLVHTAETPTLAYDNIIGDEYIIHAKNYLHDYGMINVNDLDLEITISEMGFDILVKNGLIDDSGEITDIGKELLTSYDTKKQQLLSDK